MSADSEQQHGCALFLLTWGLGWLSGAVGAFAFAKGWEWFVADTFGIPEVSFIEAWGLFALAHFATTQVNFTEPRKKAITAADCITLVLTSALTSLAVLGSLLILVQFR